MHGKVINSIENTNFMIKMREKIFLIDFENSEGEIFFSNTQNHYFNLLEDIYYKQLVRKTGRNIEI